MQNTWRQLRLPLAIGLGALMTVGVPLRAARPAAAAAAASAGTPLTVFAAASLKEAFTTIGARFDAAHGSTTRFNFGGSDTLATQLAQGAPADVFASANQTQMKVVQAKGLIAGMPTTFARNRLVVIVPRGNPGHIYNLADLGNPGVRLVLAAPSVPVGKYASAAFAVMARDAAFGPAFLARIARNTVSNETDVKAVAAKVVLGEADAGVVYVTDVTPAVAPKVAQIAVPGAYNQVATYPIAVTKGSGNASLARAFVADVLSPAGQGVLRARGFLATGAGGGYAPAVAVSGLVARPATLTVTDLRRLPTTTVTVTQRTEMTVLGTARYTGVLLNTVVQAAAPITNTSFKNDVLRDFVTVRATDGYQVSVALAEMLPTFGHEQVLLAYARNGRPLARQDGAVELIVPGDTLAGRDVKNVDSITVGTPFGTP